MTEATLTKAEELKRLPKLKKELTELENQLDMLIAEDKTEYAQDIITKMFSEFKKGAAWTERMKKYCETKLYAYSPIGRKRNLPAALTGDKAIIAQQVRRGSNAPIQGIASEVGVKSSRRIMESYYKELPIFKKMLNIKYSLWDLKVEFNRIVHDASYFSVRYCLVIPFIHILQWEATYGIAKAYKNEFDLDFTVEPEIEMEVSARDDKSYKWDWSLNNLVSCISDAVKDADELGLLEGTYEEVIAEIFETWKNKELRAYLQAHYPLLNVPDLNKQIIAATKLALGLKNE